MNDLKSFSPPKQQAVIEYVMNSEKNKLGQISKNNAQNSNSYPNELNFTQLSINTKKDLRNVKEELNKLKRISERKFRMNINELMNEFEQSIQTLLSLSNLFEQKTVYEIEKQKNSIIELLNNDNVDPQAKMSVVEKRLQILKNSITNSFTMIRKNIENYETQSDKKIKNAQTSFLSRNNKFLY